jgi:hypothetical protein
MPQLNLVLPHHVQTTSGLLARHYGLRRQHVLQEHDVMVFAEIPVERLETSPIDREAAATAPFDEAYLQPQVFCPLAPDVIALRRRSAIARRIARRARRMLDSSPGAMARKPCVFMLHAARRRRCLRRMPAALGNTQSSSALRSMRLDRSTSTDRHERALRRLLPVPLFQPGHGIDYGFTVRDRRQHAAHHSHPGAGAVAAVTQRRLHQSEDGTNLLHMPARFVNRLVAARIADGAQLLDRQRELLVDDPRHLGTAGKSAGTCDEPWLDSPLNIQTLTGRRAQSQSGETVASGGADRWSGRRSATPRRRARRRCVRRLGHEMAVEPSTTARSPENQCRKPGPAEIQPAPVIMLENSG